MSNYSQVTLEGFVTQDPLVRKTKTGKTVCNFSLSVMHNTENKDNQVSFVDIETWDKVAQSCSERVRKGKRLMVMGSLKQDRWQSPEGNQRSKIKVIGYNVRYLMARKDEERLEKVSA